MEDTNSSHNYFQKYGVQGKRNSGSYITTVTVTNSTRYAFIAVDATLDVGPRRMLNFSMDAAQIIFNTYDFDIAVRITPHCYYQGFILYFIQFIIITCPS